MIRISKPDDGGNIRVIDCQHANAIRLEIETGAQSDFYQWFYFRLTGAQGTRCRMVIENASGAAYPAGWPGYQACASTDRESWVRVPTRYEDGQLIIEVTPETNSLYLAYFPPYPVERHLDLIASAAASPLCQHEVIGSTLDGADIDLLKISGGASDTHSCWLIARQHPGETMAEWWMEGALETLLDEEDPIARALLQRFHFFLVPNMNPDGSRRGHLRTNAAGTNLNRAWLNATEETAPEVLAVRERMKHEGCVFHLDIHGDEGLPYVFLAGFEGIPSLTDAQLEAYRGFSEALKARNPDFQTHYGYPKTPAGKANLGMCTNWVAETFGAVAATLEMPFKDADNHPHPATGWSPARCRILARDCLGALSDISSHIPSGAECKR